MHRTRAWPVMVFYYFFPPNANSFVKRKTENTKHKSPRDRVFPFSRGVCTLTAIFNNGRRTRPSRMHATITNNESYVIRVYDYGLHPIISHRRKSPLTYELVIITRRNRDISERIINDESVCARVFIISFEKVRLSTLRVCTKSPWWTQHKLKPRMVKNCIFFSPWIS